MSRQVFTSEVVVKTIKSLSVKLISSSVCSTFVAVYLLIQRFQFFTQSLRLNRKKLLIIVIQTKRLRVIDFLMIVTKWCIWRKIYQRKTNLRFAKKLLTMIANNHDKHSFNKKVIKFSQTIDENQFCEISKIQNSNYELKTFIACDIMHAASNDFSMIEHT